MLTGLELSISMVSNQKSIETTTTNALCFLKTVEASLAPLGWRHHARLLLGRCSIISISAIAVHVCYWAHAASFLLLPSPCTSVLGQMQHHPTSSGPSDTMPHCVPLDIAFFSPQGLKKGKKKICIKAKIQSDGEKKLALLLFIKQCLLKVHSMGGSSETYLRS